MVRDTVGKFFHNLYKKQTLILESPEKVFLILAMVFGLVMTFLMPPLMVPDELVHFQRSYQVAHGGLVSQTVDGKTGGVVPVINNKAVDTREAVPIFNGNYFSRLSQKDYEFAAFPNSAVYSPLSYAPQAVGIRVAQTIYPSIGLMFILGRLANLAVFIFLLVLSIRIAPKGKWVYVVAGLLPMTIHQAASLSSDVMTIGLAFLTIAYIHKLFISKSLINRRSMIYILMLAVGLGLTKQTNIVLLFPLIFLPAVLFGSVSKKIISLIIVLGLSFVAAMGWYLVGKLLHYDLHFSPYDADIVRQLSLIIHHPLHFLDTLFRTFIYSGAKAGGVQLQDFYLSSVVGYFSWLSYKLPLISVIAAYAVLLVALFHSENNVKEKYLGRLAIVQAITFIVAALSIAVILYLTWTVVGGNRVDGIQGRYFIALIPLLIAPALYFQKYIDIKFKKRHYMGLIVSLVSLVNLIVMIALTIEWFYA